MYIAIVKPGKTRRGDRAFLARLGMNGTYFVIATFENVQECSNVADVLNRELRIIMGPAT